MRGQRTSYSKVATATLHINLTKLPRFDLDLVLYNVKCAEATVTSQRRGETASIIIIITQSYITVCNICTRQL